MPRRQHAAIPLQPQLLCSLGAGATAKQPDVHPDRRLCADIHDAYTTVHEALLFSAHLRINDNPSRDEVEQFVEEVNPPPPRRFCTPCTAHPASPALQPWGLLGLPHACQHMAGCSRPTWHAQVMALVELEPLRYGLVGSPGRNGLSVEQRKRLTIAVELVANPSIIFMDEPTSGLDARAANIVMRCVKSIVQTGRTIGGPRPLRQLRPVHACCRTACKACSFAGPHHRQHHLDGVARRPCC